MGLQLDELSWLGRRNAALIKNLNAEYFGHGVKRMVSQTRWRTCGSSTTIGDLEDPSNFW